LIESLRSNEQAKQKEGNHMARTAKLQAPTFKRVDDRGTLVEVVNAGPWETVITGTMRPGAVLGNHYHKLTRMFFYLVQGEARVDVVDVASGTRWSRRVAAGEGLYLECGEAHAIRFSRESNYLLLKARRFSPTDADTFAFLVEDEAISARARESGESGLTYFPI
jgi:quercetin dioxygenase-like cupin family protein